MHRTPRVVAAALALGAASARAADLPADAVVPPPAAAAAERPPPDLHARPPVATLFDLREYGAADPVVGARVDRLRSRRNVAVAAFGGAFLAGVVGSIVGTKRMLDRVDEQCPPPGGGRCEVKPEWGPALVSGGVSLVLGVVGFAILPKRADIEETVALWNGRHPEAPLEMEAAAAPEPAEPQAREQER